MSQTAFIEILVAMANLSQHTIERKTPYKLGYSVDLIPPSKLSKTAQKQAMKLMRMLIGSLNWLSISTRPDITTITNMLAKYSAKPSHAHIDSAKYIIKHLKGSKDMGIHFATESNSEVEAFIKFPGANKTLVAQTDTNWGPQDQSKPKPNESRQLNLFKTHSVSGYVLWFGRPLH